MGRRLLQLRTFICFTVKNTYASTLSRQFVAKRAIFTVSLCPDPFFLYINTIHATLSEELPEELLFIQRYDEAKKELQRIVDMPDKLLSNMLMFLHQNKGVYPKRRREQFGQLTDEEIKRMQAAYRIVYEMEPSD